MRIIKLTLLAIFCLLASFGFSQNLNTDLDMGLNGRVKSITGTEYQIGDSNDPSKDQTRRFVYTFNSANSIISNELFDSKQRILYRATYTYNSLGLLTQKNITNNELKEKSVRERYTYSKTNRLTQSTIHNSKGVLLNTLKYQYNDEDELIQLNVYDAKGKIDELESTIYTYNTFGYCDKAVTGQKKVLYTYNAQGFCIKKEEYENDVLKYIVDYQRDKAGGITRESTTTVAANNEHNVPVDSDYQYDEVGNWISLRESMEDKTFALTIRNIEYEENTDKRYIPD